MTNEQRNIVVGTLWGIAGIIFLRAAALINYDNLQKAAALGDKGDFFRGLALLDPGARSVPWFVAALALGGLGFFVRAGGEKRLFDAGDEDEK